MLLIFLRYYINILVTRYYLHLLVLYSIKGLGVSRYNPNALINLCNLMDMIIGSSYDLRVIWSVLKSINFVDY